MSISLYANSIILGATGAWVISRFAGNFGLLDCPTERSSHCTATPKGGGIGILAAFVVSVLIVGLDWSFWVPMAIVSLIGLYDDKVHASPRLRLCAQFVAVLVIILCSDIRTSILLIPFWAVFIVGTGNCYNFMDGINGIAGITGIIGFSLVGFYSNNFNLSAVISFVAFAMAMACIGFLPFNIPKALTFMGDVGSILLGFAFAGLVFILADSVLDFVCLSSFMFPFYSDEIITKSIQIVERRPLMCPHRNHLYQLMANEMGIEHWKIAVGYGFLQFVVGVSVLTVRPHGVAAIAILLVCYFALFASFNYFIRKRARMGVRSSQTLRLHS